MITDAVTLISFTIDGTTYQAEQGMTWEDFTLNETYNTEGWFVNGTFICSGRRHEILEGDGNDVDYKDVISQSIIYTWYDLPM